MGWERDIYVSSLAEHYDDTKCSNNIVKIYRPLADIRIVSRRLDRRRIYKYIERGREREVRGAGGDEGGGGLLTNLGAFCSTVGAAGRCQCRCQPFELRHEIHPPPAERSVRVFAAGLWRSSPSWLPRPRSWQ